MIASRPQITKNFASNNIDSMLKLTFKSSKFSFYLLLVINLPLLLFTPFILNKWLDDVPDLTILLPELSY